MSDMNKRKRLSGSQYKKIAKVKKEKEDHLVRKTAKLETYFKVKVSIIIGSCITNYTKYLPTIY